MGTFPALKHIYLASPRGFCAGVQRAVTIVDQIVTKYGPPIYVKHNIVHNTHVVADFEKRGVVFVEDLKEVPNGARVVFSAHGSPPALYEEAKKKNLKVVDAVCPLVTKVHLEAKRYAREGYFIFYIGHNNHPEPVGVLAEVPKETIVHIESFEDAQNVKPTQEEKLIVLSQTTLSIDDTKKIIDILKKRFPKLQLPPAFDICYATQNRQDAVKKLAPHVDLLLVVGSPASSNSNRLREAAERLGVTSYLIDDVSEIQDIWLKNVKNIGITSGASVPDTLVKDVVNYLATDKTEVKELEGLKENIYFPLPQNL